MHHRFRATSFPREPGDIGSIGGVEPAVLRVVIEGANVARWTFNAPLQDIGYDPVVFEIDDVSGAAGAGYFTDGNDVVVTYNLAVNVGDRWAIAQVDGVVLSIGPFQTSQQGHCL